EKIRSAKLKKERPARILRGSIFSDDVSPTVLGPSRPHTLVVALHTHPLRRSRRGDGAAAHSRPAPPFVRESSDQAQTPIGFVRFLLRTSPSRVGNLLEGENPEAFPPFFLHRRYRQRS